MGRVGDSLQPGDRVDLEIVEILREGMVICSLDGRLFQVRNQSSEPLQVGQKIRLIVSSRNPLEFRWSEGIRLDRRA